MDWRDFCVHTIIHNTLTKSFTPVILNRFAKFDIHICRFINCTFLYTADSLFMILMS